jgi:hypothetical protein
MLAPVARGGGEIVDAAPVIVEIGAAAAAKRDTVGDAPGIVGFGMRRIERLGIRAGQHLRTRQIGGIGGRVRGRGKLIGGGAFGRNFRALVAFQQRVALQLLLDEGGGFQIGELQQLDRLPQLRRHHERLGLTQIETRTDRHRGP